jgi:dTDP-4-dehydrorhamnose 3,5-epimerase
LSIIIDILINKYYHKKMKEPFLINLNQYRDNRGYFVEKFNRAIYRSVTDIENETVLQNCPHWVQESYSVSNKNVLRGIHYQYKSPQAKLVHCLYGKILDVIVDLRKSSPNFGKYVKYNLDDSQILYVPIGFGHSFLSLTENTIVEYKSSEYYMPEDSYSILWNDKYLNIEWGTENPTVSDKDQNGLSFEQAPKFQ